MKKILLSLTVLTTITSTTALAESFVTCVCVSDYQPAYKEYNGTSMDRYPAKTYYYLKGLNGSLESRHLQSFQSSSECYSVLTQLINAQVCPAHSMSGTLSGIRAD